MGVMADCCEPHALCSLYVIQILREYGGEVEGANDGG